MTNEAQCFIDLADLIALEFECTKCQTRLLYKLDKEPTRVVGGCPNCREELYTSEEALNSVKHLFDVLRGAPSLTNPKKLKIRLQVKPPSESIPAATQKG